MTIGAENGLAGGIESRIAGGDVSGFDRVPPPQRQGEGAAWPTVTPRLYDNLRQIAAAQLRKERLNHTLQATEIAHEAWLRLTRGEMASCRGRGHFLALCSINMRRILIEHARRRGMAGRYGHVGSSDQADRFPILASGERLEAERLEAVDDALAELVRKSPDLARVVELRFFVGLTLAQIATLEAVDVRTVKRRWSAARLVLARSLGLGAGRSDEH